MKRLVLGISTVYPQYGYVVDPIAVNGVGQFGLFTNLPQNYIYMAATDVINLQIWLGNFDRPQEFVSLKWLWLEG